MSGQYKEVTVGLSQADFDGVTTGESCVTVDEAVRVARAELKSPRRVTFHHRLHPETPVLLTITDMPGAIGGGELALMTTAHAVAFVEGLLA